ncbi:cyclin-dependent kinase inhibitor 1 isoform X1 [Danio rerio]|uniref:Cyclin-dependent kinase inhibitor 1 isoform X1 n=2 Tax=Danio rerio TaxID=7955 RepID=A0A8M1RFS1_DANRE|nr:cyclin-dependent kinase inhibitor 1 isoform X1 [Danio rerio]|eukprot:XP_003200962.1 cyclin-dependent kinase inhibitor 1 isoform X1 [Danio rerio]
MTAQRRRARVESAIVTMAAHKRILRSLGNGPTRRSLFGPVDREQLQREYRAALRRDLEDASRRWSFDFASEKPLEGGDFHWEGVSGVRVPLLYRACQEKQQKRPCEAHQPGQSAAGKENIPKTPERCAALPHEVEKTPEKSSELKRKQTNITDFYQAKKRLVATPRKSGQ